MAHTWEDSRLPGVEGVGGDQREGRRQASEDRGKEKKEGEGEAAAGVPCKRLAQSPSSSLFSSIRRAAAGLCLHCTNIEPLLCARRSPRCRGQSDRREECDTHVTSFLRAANTSGEWLTKDK